ALPPVHDRAGGAAVLDELSPEGGGLGGGRLRDGGLVAAVGPHERQELPGALVAGDRGEGEAVGVPAGERPGGLAQLVPGGGGGDARLLEQGAVAEQGDGVDRRGDAVQRPLVAAQRRDL